MRWNINNVMYWWWYTQANHFDFFPLERLTWINHPARRSSNKEITKLFTRRSSSFLQSPLFLLLCCSSCPALSPDTWWPHVLVYLFLYHSSKVDRAKVFLILPRSYTTFNHWKSNFFFSREREKQENRFEGKESRLLSRCWSGPCSLSGTNNTRHDDALGARWVWRNGCSTEKKEEGSSFFYLPFFETSTKNFDFIKIFLLGSFFFFFTEEGAIRGEELGGLDFPRPIGWLSLFSSLSRIWTMGDEMDGARENNHFAAAEGHLEKREISSGG